MKTKKPTQICMLVLIALCIVGCCFILIRDDTGFQRISGAAFLAALASMLYYVVAGAGKSEARYFKIMLILAAAGEFFSLIPHMNVPQSSQTFLTVLSCCYVASFGVYLSLGVGKDIGAVTSLVMTGTVAACKLALAVLSGWYVFLRSTVTDLDVMRFLRTAVSAAIALGVLVCVISKYRDKAQRHTK